MFVAVVLRPVLPRRDRFPEIVGQCGKTHCQRVVLRRGVIHDQQDMQACIHLRVMLRRLRYAEQGIHFRQDARQRPAVAQRQQHPGGSVFHESARQLLPDALGHEMVDFTVAHHFAHEFQRLRRDREPEAGGESRDAQHPHRVLDERLADMTQDAGLQVGDAMMRVDDVAVVVAGDCIDGEVAARQVLFQRDLRGRLDLETLVAARRLSLGARERVFLVRLRVQEYREILAHRAIAQLLHLLRRGTDHDVILVGDRPAEQPVAHCPSDRVDLHDSYCGLTSVSAWAPAIHSCIAGNA